MRTQKKELATATDWQELALKRLDGIQTRSRVGARKLQKEKSPAGMRRLKV